jgi:FHS family L-fucose permease-like MFS transporter
MANMPHTTTTSDNPADNAKNPYFGSLAALTSLFFIWGFITSLNDILIPHLKAVFTLNYTQAMLIQFCFFTAYFVVSVPSGHLVERIGFKRGIIAGLAIAGLGCLLFYPAAGWHSYPLFLAAFFVLASGITLLQVAANPYVTILGRPETASSRLTMTQAFNSLGTTIAPYLGALFILSAAVKTADEIKLLSAGELSAYQSAQAAVVQHPYLLLAAVLFLIAGLFAALKLPEAKPAGAHAQPAADDAVHQSAWSYRHLVLGAVGIFVYVGAEVSIGSFLVNYLAQPVISGLAEHEAAKYVSLYWGGAMVGRFAGAIVMRGIRPGKVLAFNALAASVLVAASMMGSGSVAMWAILAVGLFNSIMFPTLFSLAVDGLGKHTGQGSGILCTAIVGGAVVPVVQGLFADRIGIQQAFFIPALCYLYIAYYGWKGHRFVS